MIQELGYCACYFVVKLYFVFYVIINTIKRLLRLGMLND